jgi:hypothetical protein
MSGYRLHIDIPLVGSESEAVSIANAIISMISDKEKMNVLGIEQVNYRVGHDEDRQKSNYLMKNDSGHVNNKKSRIMFTDQLTSPDSMV